MAGKTPHEERLRSLPRPRPPGDLRRRVLTSAASAPPPVVTLTDRIWVSPWLRLTWAAVAVTLLWIGLGPDLESLLSPEEGPAPDARLVATLEREAGMTPEMARRAALQLERAEEEEPGGGSMGAGLWSFQMPGRGTEE